ncbi:MAG: GTPase [Buchnera aphidicola (Meitanaphis flavogallis)]
MTPLVVLVGRTNVGKSTLFNRLTCSKDALVSDFPELTRDRKYGYLKIQNNVISVVDTAGMNNKKKI